MVDSTEQANQLLANITDLKDYFEGQRPTWDGDVVVAQAAYAALTADLKGVVNSLMYFTATVDPDDPAPTNIDGGTFNTIKVAVDASPAGSYVKLYLLAGKTHVLDSTNMHGRVIELIKTGAGDNPVLSPSALATETYNNLSGFRPHGACSLRLESVDVVFPSKVDVALPWSLSNSLVSYVHGGSPIVTMSNSIVTGGADAAGLGIMSVHAGGVGMLGVYGATFDGPIYAVNAVASGSVLIGKHTVTLLNGAALTDGGTIGVNILQN